MGLGRDPDPELLSPSRHHLEPHNSGPTERGERRLLRVRARQLVHSLESGADIRVPSCSSMHAHPWAPASALSKSEPPPIYTPGQDSWEQASHVPTPEPGEKPSPGTVYFSTATGKTPLHSDSNSAIHQVPAVCPAFIQTFNPGTKISNQDHCPHLHTRRKVASGHPQSLEGGQVGATFHSPSTGHTTGHTCQGGDTSSVLRHTGGG